MFCAHKDTDGVWTWRLDGHATGHNSIDQRGKCGRQGCALVGTKSCFS